ncbi:MAG: hypothetical protein GY694_17245 [Gammaproteobacteria bacterium]|nr:hypothetical protein [Gammaproteobacteria bacterium]
MNNATVFTKVIKFHISYLKEVQQSINSGGNYFETSHKVCTMGRWLHGEAAYEVKILGPQAEKIFQQLHELHETFHEVSDAAYQAFNEGDLKLAKSSLIEMLYLSDKLTKLLMELNQMAIEAQTEADQQTRRATNDK